jgi:WD40 repeat protein/tetratricopeptide (TPR) repeat protein
VVALNEGHVIGERLAVSPDEDLLAVSRLDHRILFLDPKDGKERRALFGHTDDVTAVAFGPDGRRLYSASKDRTVRAWNTQDGEQVMALRGHRGPVAALAVSPDGRLLATGDAAGAVNLWDATSEDPEALDLIGRSPVLPGSFGALNVKESGGLAARPAVFTDAGRRFTICNESGNLSNWDTRCGALLARASLDLQGRQRVRGWDFSADGRWAAVRLSLGDDTDFQRRLARAAKDRHGARATGKSVRPLEAPEVGNGGIAFSADGRLLAAASGGNVKVWDVQSGRKLWLLGGHPAPVRYLAISPDGRWLVSTSESDSDFVKISPGAKQGLVQVWDLGTGKLRWKLPQELELLTPPVFSADGRWLLTPRQAGSLQVWDLRRQAAGAVLSPESVGLVAAFSPDGNVLARAAGTEVTLWAADTGKRLRTLRGHGRPVHALAFSPDGRRLVSSVAPTGRFSFIRRAGEMLVWDVETGRQLLALDGQGEVLFSPDGRVLASVAEQIGLRLWDARPPADDVSALRLQAWQKRRAAWHEFHATVGMREARARAGTIHHLDWLIRLEPRQAYWYIERAKARVERKEYNRAVADLTRAIDIEPAAFYFALRGNAYRKLGEPAKAVADLTEAIRRGNDNPSTLRWRGSAYADLEQYGKAVADFTFALALTRGEHINALAERGEALAALGRWREAEQDLAHALAIDDREASDWSRRLLTLLAARRERAYRQLVGFMVRKFGGSEQRDDLEEVVWACIRLPGILPAESLLRLALRACPDGKEAATDAADRAEQLLLLGAAFCRAGLAGSAEPKLREAERLRGKDASGIEALFLALALEALGKKAEARAALERGVKQLTAREKRLTWQQRVTRQAVRREAEARLGR